MEAKKGSSKSSLSSLSLLSFCLVFFPSFNIFFLFFELRFILLRYTLVSFSLKESFRLSLNLALTFICMVCI